MHNRTSSTTSTITWKTTAQPSRHCRCPSMDYPARVPCRRAVVVASVAAVSRPGCSPQPAAPLFGRRHCLAIARCAAQSWLLAAPPIAIAFCCVAVGAIIGTRGGGSCSVGARWHYRAAAVQIAAAGNSARSAKSSARARCSLVGIKRPRWTARRPTAAANPPWRRPSRRRMRTRNRAWTLVIKGVMSARFS